MSVERKNVHSMNEFTEIFRELGNEKLIMKRISTGITSLDAILGGGLVAGVHTICAEPGAGKPHSYSILPLIVQYRGFQ